MGSLILRAVQPVDPIYSRKCQSRTADGLPHSVMESTGYSHRTPWSLGTEWKMMVRCLDYIFAHVRLVGQQQLCQ